MTALEALAVLDGTFPGDRKAGEIINPNVSVRHARLWQEYTAPSRPARDVFLAPTLDEVAADIGEPLYVPATVCPIELEEARAVLSASVNNRGVGVWRSGKWQGFQFVNTRSLGKAIELAEAIQAARVPTGGRHDR